MAGNSSNEPTLYFSSFRSSLSRSRHLPVALVDTSARAGGAKQMLKRIPAVGNSGHRGTTTQTADGIWRAQWFCASETATFADLVEIKTCDSR